MNRVNIPDPQLIERDALDDAFYEWLAGNDEYNNDSELYEAAVEKWNECSPSFPLSWSGEEWMDMHEDDRESAFWAMEKDLADEINKKRQLLHRINETGDIWRR